MSNLSYCPYPGVSVPSDVLSRPREERFQLAIEAIQGSGMKPNGEPCFSAREAEKYFGVPRSSLGRRLLGMKILQDF
jgi:hypothetical protein